MKKRMCYGGSLLFITTLLLAFSCARQEEDPVPGGNGRDVQFSAVSRPDADAARTRAEGISDEEADATVWIDWDGVSWVKEREGCRQAPETRTVYSGKTYGNPKKERIDWVDGDRMSIWCDQNQDPATKMVDYAVTRSGNENEIDKGTIKAIPSIGLRWSSETGTHWFEGVYPGATTTGEKSFDSFEADGADKLKFSFHIPESQTGTQGTAGDTTFIAPNMAYAPMAAKASGTKNGGTVTLTFLPVFTAFQITVRNRFADKPMTVKKIGIEYAGTNGTGLSGAGTWSMTRNANADPGYAPGTPVTQKVEWSHSGLVLPAGTTKALRVTLLALPADLDAVNLCVETAESGLRKLPIKKNGSFYAFAGRKKYNINLGPLPDTPPSNFTITITQPEAFLHTGASSIGHADVRDTVRSYRAPVNDPDAKSAVPWKLQYSTDNGATWSDNRPATSWVTGITQTGNGSVSPDGESGTVTVSPNNAAKTTADAALRGTPPVPGVYDLSTNGGTTKRYTANCYLVNGPGTYRFPLVYGNAIKADQKNEASYKASYYARSKARSKQSYDRYFLPQMIRHDGNPIKAPEIDRNLTAATSRVTAAGLVWQDAPGLISDIRLVSEHGVDMPVPNDSSLRYIQFTVGADLSKLVQGNAVLDARTATGVTVWSWHIWITPYRLGDDLITVEATPGYEIEGGESATLPIPLGWCDFTASTIPGRSLLVRAVQTVPGGATSAPVTIAQYGHYVCTPASPANFESSETRNANCCYYQWGRKDPFPGSKQTPGNPSANAVEGDGKPVYDLGGTVINTDWLKDWSAFQKDINAAGTDITIATAITTPSVFYHSNNLHGFPTWVKEGNQRRNLWKINQLSKKPDYNSFLNRATDDFDRGRESRIYGQKTVYDPCPAGYMVPPFGLLARGKVEGAPRTPKQRSYDYLITKGYPKMRMLVYTEKQLAAPIRGWFTKPDYWGTVFAYNVLFSMWTSASYGENCKYGANVTTPFTPNDWINDVFENEARQAFGCAVFPGKYYDLEPAQ